MATYYTNWSISNSSNPNSATYIVDGQQVTYYNDVRYKFVVTESVNSSANTSTLTVKKYAVFYFTWPDMPPLDLVVTMKSKMPNNTSYKSDTDILIPESTPNSYELVGTDTFTIEHDPDGTKTVSFTGLGTYTGGSGTVYTRTVSKQIALTKIDRTSTIATNATKANKKLFGQAITFNASRKVEGVTHKLSYVSGNSTIVIGDNLPLTSAYTYTFPTTLISNYPSAVENIIYVTCETFLNDQSLGSNTVACYLNVPNTYAPNIQLSIAEGNPNVSALNLGIFVQSRSQIHGIINATGQANATIVSYNTSFNNEVFKTQEFTSGLLNETTDTININVTVTDSRGLSNTITQQIEVEQYSSPAITSSIIKRCLQDGTIDDNGTYGKATISYQIFSLDNKNTKNIAFVFNGSSQEFTLSEYVGTFESSVIFSELNTDNTYNIVCELIDIFGNETKTSIAITVDPTFILESDFAGGKGKTFGRNATEEGIHSYIDFETHKDLKAKNINVSGLKIEKIQNIYIMYIE